MVEQENHNWLAPVSSRRGPGRRPRGRSGRGWGGGVGGLLLAVALLLCPQVVAAQSAEGGDPAAGPVRVAVVSDPGPAADSLARQVESEVEALFAGRRDVRFARSSTADPWTPAAARTASAQARSSGPDAVVLVGPVTTTAVCGGGTPGQAEEPTVAVAMGSGLLRPDATPGRCDIVETQGDPGALLSSVRRLTPIDRVQVIVDARVADAIDGAAERVRQWGEAVGVSAQLVPMRSDWSADALATGGDRSAVYLAALDRWASEEVRALTQALTARGVPVLAADPAHVERHGALAALDASRSARARHAALALEGWLTGTPPPALDSTGAPPASPLVLNRAVAASQGLALPWRVQVDARLVGTLPDSTEPTTLAESMQESIRANLHLRAERQRTAAEANRVDIARSRLLPEVNVSATGRTVSEDVAAASLGSQPQREISSAVSFRQVLFSEPALANLSIERRMQAMREFEQQSTRLDAAKRAADAYVDVLQARAAVDIQRENLRVVRTNLRAARTRRAAGAADPREVSRLETQEARAEQGLLRALGRQRSAEIQYNRVLDRPLDAPVRLARAVGVDPRPVLDWFPYRSVLTQADSADAFRQFWVGEARTRAPEVQAMDQLVSARERQSTAANRSFWLPTLSLEGQFSQRMMEDGTGTSGLDLQLPGSGPGGLPTPPDQQWSVGITASFPIFDGTQRAARYRQTQDQLSAARTRRVIAETGVEQQVRTALVALETTHEAVQRALRAADAAQRTLNVTQAAYRQGTASLVDLIDAQSAALTTRQEASDAAYGLIRDWIAVQRAGGSFRVLRTPQEQADFRARLRSSLTAAQAEGPRR